MYVSACIFLKVSSREHKFFFCSSLYLEGSTLPRFFQVQFTGIISVVTQIPVQISPFKDALYEDPIKRGLTCHPHHSHWFMTVKVFIINWNHHFSLSICLSPPPLPFLGQPMTVSMAHSKFSNISYWTNRVKVRQVSSRLFRLMNL